MTRPTGPLSPFERVWVEATPVALPQQWPLQSRSFLSFRSDPPCLSCSLSNLPQEKHCFFFFHLRPLSSGPACWGPRNVNFKLCRARLSTPASSGHWAWWTSMVLGRSANQAVESDKENNHHENCHCPKHRACHWKRHLTRAYVEVSPELLQREKRCQSHKRHDSNHWDLWECMDNAFLFKTIWIK